MNQIVKRIGRKSKSVELSCLAFAGDLAIVDHSDLKARKQVEDLKVSKKIVNKNRHLSLLHQN